MSVTPMRPPTATETLAARLEDPEVAAALTTLLDHADLLAVLVEGLSGMVARSETIGASVVDGVKELRETVDASTAGQDLDLGAIASAAVSLAAVLPKAAPGMVAAVDSGAIDRVLGSGIVSPESVDQVATLAAGLANGSRTFGTDPVRVSGPLSLVRLLRDPDISRALSFFATVARAVGQELAKPSTLASSS